MAEASATDPALTLYTWTTPNGRKPAILLEELGLPYTAVPVHIGKDEQFSDSFKAINPNSKIPALVDADGPGGEPLAVFESGAILIYLAEKTGSAFLPTETRARTAVLQWLMFQMGGIGPMYGQAGHFRNAAPEPNPYGIERYTKESTRLTAVMDGQLAENAYLAGDYSIADMATYPWVKAHDFIGLDLEPFVNVRRWMADLEARPAVQKGMAVLKDG